MSKSGMRLVLVFAVCCIARSEAQFPGFGPPPQPFERLTLNLSTLELNRLQELVDSLQVEQYDKFLVDKVRLVFPHQMTQRLMIDRLPLFNSPPTLSMVLGNLTDPKIREIQQMKNSTQIPALISVYRELLSRVAPAEIRLARNILAPLLFGRYNVIEGLGNGIMFPQLPHFPLPPNGAQIPGFPNQPTIQLPQIGNQVNQIPQITNQMGQVSSNQQGMNFPGSQQGMTFPMYPSWYGWPKPTPMYWPAYSMFMQKPFWPRQR
ncbi:hypothetical protein L596_016970 [Steinernema carpocapsae]|uniref:SXP/RAL-2 family protein Ani s 5-like cation-binding domain-containing protein n=1 Tax=Steinernema carpocapsae TaxID=34508 RepID=A0A4U5N0C5_STECR|nr:hypothetical protein L596_016970 [Steinernema carpocapsae]